MAHDNNNSKAQCSLFPIDETSPDDSPFVMDLSLEEWLYDVILECLVKWIVTFCDKSYRAFCGGTNFDATLMGY